MTEKQRVKIAVELLKKDYPDAICSLDYDDAFHLLVATRLAAQCTDARVNIVTPGLFAKFPTPRSFAEADVQQVEELIKSCGLYKTKAKDLVALGKMLTEKFGERVPDTMEELTSLPGIGRKTANLILGDVYGKPAVVTDTHFIRICNRLGFVETTVPEKVEKIMRELLEPAESNDFCHRTVLHGREVCTARKPYCDRCSLEPICKKKFN